MWDSGDMCYFGQWFRVVSDDGCNHGWGVLRGASYGVQSNKHKFVTLCSRFIIAVPKKIELPLAPM